jgi:hypothetical protein
MFKSKRIGSVGITWWMGLACVGGLGVFLGFSSTKIPLSVKAERTFNLPIDLDSFRQILVRTKATEAVVNHGGMKLLEETTESLDIDLKNDSRPLRNFLRGKSKANVTATKHLRVQLNDPQINASELLLTQDCRIQPENIRIVSTADGPSGHLKAYSTTLEATKGETGTDIALSIEMTIDVHVLWVFQSQAKIRVGQAANKTLEDQEASLRSLVER